jgi:hypothetical protein
MSVLSRLSGWQRLWLVLSVIYLIAVAAFTVILMPKASQYLSSRVYDTVRTIKDNVPELSGMYVYQIREAYSDFSDEEIIQKIHEKYKDEVDFDAIEKKYRNKMSRLPSMRAKFIGLGLLFWVAPIVLVYILGISVGWIVKGFKKEPSK